MSLFEEIELYENTKKFVLLPRSTKQQAKADLLKPAECDYNNIVVIDRQTNTFSKVVAKTEQEKQQVVAGMKTYTRIFGVVGIIELLSGMFCTW